MMIDYKLIGQRIAKCRKNKKITQETLAEYLDVSTTFISKIECGKTHINLERLVQICHFLDTSPSELLTGAESTSEIYMNPELASLMNRCPNELLPLMKSVIEDILKHYPGN